MKVTIYHNQYEAIIKAPDREIILKKEGASSSPIKKALTVIRQRFLYVKPNNIWTIQVRPLKNLL